MKSFSVEASSSFSAAPQVQGLQVFHVFERLPLELRQMIWTLACTSRVVEVGFYVTKAKGRPVARQTSRTVVPAILHTCSESRAFGLKIYEPFTPTGIFSGTYINWTLDFVYLDWGWDDFFTFRRMLPAKSALPQNCRRLLIGRRLHMSRKEIFQVFHRVKDVAVIWLPSEHQCFYYTYPRIPEIAGSPYSSIELEQIDESHSPEVAKYMKDYRGMYYYVDQHRADFDKISVVLARRGARPLSREERKARSEREKDLKLRIAEPVPPKMINFRNWRMFDLKNEATNRGLSTDGSKAVLLARLNEDESQAFSKKVQEYEQGLQGNHNETEELVNQN